MKMYHIARRRFAWMAALAITSMLAAGCPKAPRGFEQVSTEIALNQVETYVLVVREAYKTARRENVIGPADFLLAVKADESFSAFWNRYLFFREKKDPKEADAFYLAVDGLRLLEKAVLAFAPYVKDSRPEILTSLFKEIEQ